MKTKLPNFLFVLVVLFATAGASPQGRAKAESTMAGSSAALTKTRNVASDQDERVKRLSLFLKSRNSPLKSYAQDFIRTADKYGVDWKLVPSITGVESSFGLAIPQGSYNAYGWANGEFYFKSWPDSIEVVTKVLRENYIDRGADTVWKIAPIYAPPSQTWAGKVSNFMNNIENFPDPKNTRHLALSL